MGRFLSTSPEHESGSPHIYLKNTPIMKNTMRNLGLMDSHKAFGPAFLLFQISQSTIHHFLCLR
jgi:hypothetical protein